MPVPSRALSDALAEYVCVLGLIAALSGKIAGEVYAMMTTELGEASEPAPVGTIGSSTMPHNTSATRNWPTTAWLSARRCALWCRWR
jgi:adenylosuccinate lyase